MREAFYAEYFRMEDRHWWFLGRRHIVMSLLAEHLAADRDRNDMRILDLGCGTGTMLGYLRQFGHAEGVDADLRAIGFCRARGEDEVQVLESETLPFPDDSFNLVTALDVLEHIEDDRAAMSEVARVLRPGGTLLVTVPAFSWLWGAQDEISHHFRRYTARELEGRLLEAELRPARLTYFNALLFPPICAIRLARRMRRSKGEPRSDFELTSLGPMNRLLARVFASEAHWLRRADLPVGVSLLAFASAPPATRL